MYTADFHSGAVQSDARLLVLAAGFFLGLQTPKICEKNAGTRTENPIGGDYWGSYNDPATKLLTLTRRLSSDGYP